MKKFLFLLLVLFLFAGCNLNSNKLAPQSESKTSINFLVSTEPYTNFCNGADMDSDGYKKSLTQVKTVEVAGNLNLAEKIKVSITKASNLANLMTAIQNQPDFIKIVDDTAYIAPIDAWAGVSIFLCAWKPLVETNILQYPEIKKVMWVSDQRQWEQIIQGNATRQITLPNSSATINIPFDWFNYPGKYGFILVKCDQEPINIEEDPTISCPGVHTFFVVGKNSTSNYGFGKAQPDPISWIKKGSANNPEISKISMEKIGDYNFIKEDLSQGLEAGVPSLNYYYFDDETFYYFFYKPYEPWDKNSLNELDNFKTIIASLKINK